ncbi:MAG: heparinase II/III family protein [Planctomycetota bacterium]|nr:heparinase II/III family protein [Planctomycetota bacterium]
MKLALSLNLLLSLMAVSGFSQTEEGLPSTHFKVELSAQPFPRIAATPLELQRLRTAWRSDHSDRQQVVADRLAAADRAIAGPLVFPARGGQHNQWYQCRDCQLALQQNRSGSHQCPQCGRIYRGEPYDDVIFGRQHRTILKSGLDAAWAYAITEEKKYGEYAASVLTGYAERYQVYPYHTNRREKDPTGNRSGGHLFEQTLTEASAYATYVAPTYDLVRAGGFLTDEQDKTIRQGLLRPMVENVGKYRVGKSNWQTWHNAALIAGGAVLGDKALVDRAIADPKHGFLKQMEISVTDDGMWYENSWAYHFYTLRAMILIAEYARRLEIDLWSNPRLQSMFSIGPGYAMPGGQLPRFGDDVNSRVHTASESLEFAFHAQPTPGLQPFLNTQNTWDSVMLGRTVSGAAQDWKRESKLFPAAGHAILQTGGPAGLASAMTFGPYGGFHGHLDKLSFVFFGWEQELGVDPGRARSQAYRLPIHKNWYKATLSHNAVVVDGDHQAPASGELLGFEAKERYSAAVARCRDAYPGVSHSRLLFQTDSYLLIFDNLIADSDRRFDWFYHNRGESVGCDIAMLPQKLLESDYPGMEYVKDTLVGKTNDILRVRFEAPALKTQLTLDGQRDTEVLTGSGVGSSILNRVPLIRVTRHGKTARFLAVLEPLPAGTQEQVESVQWEEQSQGVIRIKIKGPELEHQIEVRPDSKNPIRSVRFSKGCP